MSARRIASGLAIAFALSGCVGGGSTLAQARLADADRARTSEATAAARALAPQVAAEGDDELRRAREAQSAGDDVAANLHAERALASYARAAVLARLSRATEDESSAKRALGAATESLATNAAARRDTDREVADLDKKLRVARDLHAPAGTSPGDPEREKARKVAAESLLVHATLLCGAARLVSTEAPGLAEAQKSLDDAKARLASGAKASAGGSHVIDAAARARAACLSALTHARRAKGASADQTDALLGEVSAALTAAGRGRDATATRDERGVVVTLRGAFQGAALTKDGEALVKELARVASAHPTLPVQVVLHTAEASEKAQADGRAASIKTALEGAGLSASRVGVENAGAGAPVVDPNERRLRARNARAEIVFVAAE